ncbi:hypothetical protein ScPMuIL_012605 [Solemya velum]
MIFSSGASQDVPYLRDTSHDADCSEDEEEDGNGSLMNSMDGDVDAFSGRDQPIPYSVTPPVNKRYMKRAKVKQHNNQKKTLSYKDYKEYLEKKKNQPKTVVTVIKEKYPDGQGLLSLGHIDSDDSMDREARRELKERKRKDGKDIKKTFKTSRGIERDEKLHPKDLISLVPDSQDTQLKGTRARKKFNSPRLIMPTSNVLNPLLDDRIMRRGAFDSSEICPNDRIEFYRIFSMLINMGSHGKKEKDGKDRMVPGINRQLSSEQEYWQTQFNDLLWIELQTKLNDCSVQEQVEMISQERERVPNVLNSVLNFKVDCKDIIDIYVRCEGDETNISSPNNVVLERTSPSPSTSYQNFITPEILQKQREAMSQVEDLLEDLDMCEKMFPTSKAFGKTYELYASESFVQRVKCLYLWLNITRDLCHKMKVLEKILGVQNIEGLHWPIFDCGSHRDSLNYENSVFVEIPDSPYTQTCSEDDEGSNTSSRDDKEVVHSLADTQSKYKKVHFSVASESEKSSRAASPMTIQPLPNASSTPLKASAQLNSLGADLHRNFSDPNLEDGNKISVYRYFVDKSLKKMGMNKLILRLRDLLDRTLQRAREVLEQPRSSTLHLNVGAKSPIDDRASQVSSSPSLELVPELRRMSSSYIRSHSLTDNEDWSEQFVQMGLPSFRPSYLFLVRIPLDVIHEALRLRIEQRPLEDPSFLSIRQLIRECKEVLKGAVLVKQYYQYMVSTMLWEDETAEEKSAIDLEQFDGDMRKMLSIYFSYLQNWMIMLQSLPEASRSLKDVLEEQWSFTKEICPHVIGGEPETCKQFSILASSLLNSISDFLESGIDECTTSLYDLTTGSEHESSDDDDDDGNSVSYQEKRSSEVRHTFLHTCRVFKNLFHEARERASKALGFAKMLCKDLEIAADFNFESQTLLLQKLEETNHVRVLVPLSTCYLMFIPTRIMQQTQLILQLLNVTCGRDDLNKMPSFEKDFADGYLLMVHCPETFPESPLWKGNDVQVEPTAETAIALSHIEVESLLLVVIHSTQLTSQRKDFEKMMGKNIVQLVNEQTACHQAIAESLTELKFAATELQDKVSWAIHQMDERLNFDIVHALEENDRSNIAKLYRETMLQSYNFGFEYHKEVQRLVTGDARRKLGRKLIAFAKDWMKFVAEKCERGRGMRPRWASQGFEFLIVACDPYWSLSLLTEEEFTDLKNKINDCVSHIIGTADRSTPQSPTHGMPMSRSSSNDFSRQPVARFVSWPEGKISRTHSNKSTQSEPSPTLYSVVYSLTLGSKRCDSQTTVELQDGEDGGIVMDIHLRRRSRVISRPKYRERVCTAVRQLEKERDQKLQEKRRVGRQTNKKSEIDYHISVRRVNFRWQRGNKIGEGQFGKVYTAVNMDTGELMAMKEMKFQTSDHKTLKETIDEIKNFEGIQHNHLVSYYGVEVFKDEMLIFMEYCDRGTIEDAAKMGLPEYMIRKYTGYILVAVNHLHEHGIVHRDIKGANIFLTSDGLLKLGDFGCSVKLKNHTTMPGEVNTLVGTTAYMAPEVITRNDKEGHGRAADIWSIGCVVVEMATGKRPWHEFENNYQIMFKVGMGGTPAIPDSLSDEGKDFLSHCFEIDSSERFTANQLQDHSFAKIYLHDEGEEEQPSETSQHASSAPHEQP